MQKDDSDKYAKKAHEAGAKIRQVIDAASGEVTDITEEAEKRIHENPVQSTLLALGAGLVLGLILGRR